MASRTLLERFEEKVDRTGGPDTCHEWQASRHVQWGYGHIRVEGKVLVASRVAWYLEYGVWPSGLILHACDNPPCVNIRHLSDGDQLENVRQMIDRGRRYSVLTPNQAEEALRRSLQGESYRSISRAFGVHHSTVSLAVRRGAL